MREMRDPIKKRKKGTKEGIKGKLKINMEIKRIFFY